MISSNSIDRRWRSSPKNDLPDSRTGLVYSLTPDFRNRRHTWSVRPGLLQSALARPQASFDGKELHPDLFSKAAALLYSLVNNHPFVDGNKRTGITSAGIFLRLNGWEIIATNEELEQYTLLVASSHPEIGEIRNWFKKHSHKRKDD